MSLQSREILKDHTPRQAAAAIYRACEMAIQNRGRGRRGRRSAKSLLGNPPGGDTGPTTPGGFNPCL